MSALFVTILPEPNYIFIWGMKEVRETFKGWSQGEGGEVEIAMRQKSILALSENYWHLLSSAGFQQAKGRRQKDAVSFIPTS